MKISLFKTSKDKAPSASLTLAEFIKRIKKGEWEPWINKIRASKGEEAQKKLKANLPAVTICGTCSGRAIQKSSGYIGIDVDAQDNAKDLLSKIPALHNDQYVHALWRSSRGNGLWIVFKINYKKHTESFLGIEEYLFKTYGIIADRACKDNSRLCYVSYDEEAYIAHNKKVFTKLGRERLIPGVEVEGDVADYPRLKAMTQQLVQAKKDITSDYNDWMRLGMLYAELGSRGRDLYHQLSQFNPKYTKVVADLQFNKCLKDVAKDRTIQGYKPVSTKTLAYLMLKAGIIPKVPKVGRTKSKDKVLKEGSVVDAGQMEEEGEGVYTFGLLEFKMVSKGKFKCTGMSVARTAEWLYKKGMRAHMKEFFAIEDNVVRSTHLTEMYDMVFIEVKSMPKGISFSFDGTGDAITRDTAMAAAQSTIKKIVDTIPLGSFDPDDASKFLRDTKDTIYLKFEDGIAEIDAKGYKLVPYSKALGLVWRKTIKPFALQFDKGRSDVDFILEKAIGKQNRDAYMTAIGYMLSTYFPPEGVQMLFCCDASLEEGINNGGNGKDFIRQIIGQFREVVNVPGKPLDLKKEFAMHKGNKDTEVFWIEDLNRATKMDTLYNFTNGVEVRRLHTQAFHVQAKVGFSLQHTIDIEGNSNERRQIWLLFNTYFGKLPHGIASEFGQIFDEEWSLKKRHKFNRFIVECCQRYLKKGLIKMSMDALKEARKDELGDDLYSQLEVGKKYTSANAMEAVSRGGISISEMSQKMFINNWRKWCEHMHYDLTFMKTDRERYYIMQKKTTLNKKIR